MATPVLSFDKFKKSFYGRVSDLTLFDGSKYNFLKVVLDGLKVNYTGRGKIRVLVFSGNWMLKLFLRLMRMKGSASVNEWNARLRKWKSLDCTNRLLLIDAGGRIFKQENQKHSFYYDNIIRKKGKEKVALISYGSKEHADNSDMVIPVYDLALLSAVKCDARFFKMKSEVQKVMSGIEGAGLFSAAEIANIRIAFQQFLVQYAVWNEILDCHKNVAAMVWPHYHSEGCIAALKEHGIHITEVQHGLIAEEDIFYGFPEQVKSLSTDLLFADRILVYGEFWKEQVLKGNLYREQQVKVAGYFPHQETIADDQVEAVKNLFPGKKIVLVTTQTFLHKYFIEYVQFLSDDISKRGLAAGICVKLHPAEKPELYSILNNLPNVQIVNGNIDVFLRAADYHISIYSTTMFDALRAGVKNFAIWQEEVGDYIRFFEREKISTVIQPRQNPMDVSASEQNSRPVEWYYSAFNPAVI